MLLKFVLNLKDWIAVSIDPDSIAGRPHQRMCDRPWRRVWVKKSGHCPRNVEQQQHHANDRVKTLII